MIDRHWFLTWRTYGTWLPGDDRGFVGVSRGIDRRPQLENAPDSPQSAPQPHLHNFAVRTMSGPPVELHPAQSVDLLEQFQQTAGYRGWELLTAAVLSNHIHLVVGVDGDPDGGDILGDFKSYASRRLNRLYGARPNGSWWAESGSRRVLKREHDLIEAVRYVARQKGAFLVWVSSKVREWVIQSEPPAG